MKKINILFLLCIIGALAWAAYFGINYKTASETAMVQSSYGITPLLVTGIAGLSARKHKYQAIIAGLWGLICFLLLFIFYIKIFPML